MPKQRVPLKLSTSITLMVSAIIASVLLVVFALFFVQMSREGQDQLQQKAIAVANTLALSNTVSTACSGAITAAPFSASPSRCAIKTSCCSWWWWICRASAIRTLNPG